MNQGPKAKIEIEIDDAEARRQMDALRAEYGQPGGGGGSTIQPGGGRRPPPPATGGGGGAFGLSMGKMVGAAAAAAVAAAMKDTVKDAMAPLALAMEDLSKTVNKFVNDLTGLGDSADKDRATMTALERGREFGRQTMGMASSVMEQTVMLHEFRMEAMRNRGERSAANRWAEMRRSGAFVAR